MTSSILCPSCRTSQVPVPSFTFDDTSVEVTVCDSCQESGLVSVRVRKSGLIDLEVPQTSAVWHRDGLVAFV